MEMRKDYFEGGQNLDRGTQRDNDEPLAGLVPFKITSDASAGGAATESMVFTGLKAGDEILALTQRVAGAGTGKNVEGYAAQVDDGLDVTWNADPGAGAILELLVRRPTGHKSAS